MDCQVPECLGLVSGAGDGYLLTSARMPGAGDDYLLTDELVRLLRNGDGGGGAGSSVDGEKPPPATGTDCGVAVDQPILSWSCSVAGEAEMASWLSQVFDEPSDPQVKPGATTTTHRNRSSAAEACAGCCVVAGETPASVAATTSSNTTAACRGCCGCRPRSGGGKRSSCAGRAAEQRRRDKINEKIMKTLQQLVPRCSKTDKASTLDGVIRYMKSLQFQLQVLSSGYAMAHQSAYMHPAPGYVFRGMQLPVAAAAATMMPLPPPREYPFVPAMFACPHHRGNVAAAGVSSSAAEAAVSTSSLSSPTARNELASERSNY